MAFYFIITKQTERQVGDDNPVLCSAGRLMLTHLIGPLCFCTEHRTHLYQTLLGCSARSPIQESQT